MIRIATHADIPECLRMGREFIESAGFDFNAAVAEQTLRQLIVSPDGALFVVDGGMIGGLVYQHFFNAERIAQELFWWVDPEKRGGTTAVRLLDAFSVWAKERGAMRLTMIALDASDGDRVGDLYRRRGFEPLERTFVRSL